MKPTYFDMIVRDIDQAQQFFETVFGWQFTKMPGSDNYYRIEAGPKNEAGINGGIGVLGQARISEGRPLTQISVPVANLEAAVAQVKAKGGYVMEPRTKIPGVGWYATCAEPGGLLFGMLQLDRQGADTAASKADA
jgi:predicted enzyme related to lactoylglutathione lyase